VGAPHSRMVESNAPVARQVPSGASDMHEMILCLGSLFGFFT
jgi:hypothetical protein